MIEKIKYVFPEIKTQRLSLKQFSVNDANSLYLIFNKKEVNYYFRMNHFKSVEDAEKSIKNWNFYRKQGLSIRWKICLKDSDEMIGAVVYRRFINSHNRAETGYYLDPSFWRKGIISEALTAIFSYGKNHLGLHTVAAYIDNENIPSQQLIKSLGFKKEADFTDYTYFNGNYYNTLVFCKIF